MLSLCAGGATAAANAGVEDRLFKRHGRWKSASAKDYVKVSVERRLEVTRQSGSNPFFVSLSGCVRVCCCVASYTKKLNQYSIGELY